MDGNCSSPIGLANCLNVAFPPPLAASCWDLVPVNYDYINACDSPSPIITTREKCR